jgi:hypothetical protein
MSTISSWIGITGNSVGWVLLGLFLWGIAYAQLYEVGSEAIGDALTLILGAIPLGVALVAFNMMAGLGARGHFFKNFWEEGYRWSHFYAVLFGLLTIAACVYFLWSYSRSEKVRDVFKEREIWHGSPKKGITKVVLITSGVLWVVGVVFLCVLGGWELIQGSVFLGTILGSGGLLVFLLCQASKWKSTPVLKYLSKADFCEPGYSALRSTKVAVETTRT